MKTFEHDKCAGVNEYVTEKPGVNGGKQRRYTIVQFVHCSTPGCKERVSMKGVTCSNMMFDLIMDGETSPRRHSIFNWVRGSFWEGIPDLEPRQL